MMMTQGVADLEAAYRNLVASVCGIPSTPQVCFGDGGLDPCVVFVLGLPSGLHPLDSEGQAKFDQLRTAMRLDPDDVYITSVIKTLPLASRPPHPADVRRDRPWLDRQLRSLSPRAIVAFGPKVGAMLTSCGVQESEPGKVSSLALEGGQHSTPVHITHEFSVLTQPGRDEVKAKEMWSHLQAVMQVVAS